MSPGKAFSKERYISLETYKKSGEAVRTPVWLIEEGGVVFIRTDPSSWKAKRMRRNHRVRLAPSDMRGTPKGEWVDGEARFVEGEEAERVLKLITKKYGLMGRVIESGNSLRGRHPTAVIAITTA